MERQALSLPKDSRVPVRTLVADDNAAFLSALRDTLSGAAEIDLVAAVASGREVLAAVGEHRPDVVVLDVQMPGGGPQLAADLLRRDPALRLMCLSARDDADTVLSMLAAGATGYVAKGTVDADLATCVRQCAGGMLFVIAACAGEVRSRIGRIAGPPLTDPGRSG